MSPFSRRLLLLAAATAGILAGVSGCGGGGLLPQAVPSVPPVYASPAPYPGSPYPGYPYPANPYPANPQPGLTAGMVLYLAQRAFVSLPGYHSTMNFMQRNGSQVASGVYDLTGVPPYTLRIDILQGTGSGTKLLWTGGQTVEVRPSGFLSLVTVNLPLTDSRLVSIRGYALSQTNTYSLLRMAADPQNRATLLSADPPLVQVTGPHLLPGCTRMFAKFSPGSYFPQEIEFDDPTQMVVQMQLSGFVPDPSPSLAI